MDIDRGSGSQADDLAEANPLARSGYRAPGANGVPRPDHVVIVIEENHSYSEIIGSSAAPYINSLAAQGALFTQSHATTHPSQPNYLHLFSGSNQGPGVQIELRIIAAPGDGALGRSRRKTLFGHE